MPKRKIAKVTGKAKRAAATRKNRTAVARAAPSTLPWLRSPSGSYHFQLDAERATTWSRELQHAAMRWTYIVRNRQRWRGLAASARTQSDRARTLLIDLGLDAADLDLIAGDGMVEVVVPYTREEIGWEARIFPWEYVLAAATSDARRGRNLTIVRRLTTPAHAPQPQQGLRVLYVESAPGELRQDYSFDTERTLVHDCLKPKPNAWNVLLTPTLDQLQKSVAVFKPDIVHLAGFDTHQGLLLLGKKHDPNEGEPDAVVPDGYLLASDAGQPVPVSALTLASALCAGGHRPSLVLLNLQNSAARVAPLLVAEGAGAAIGFQDIFDDDLSELFFATFYRELRHAKWHLASAFEAAWSAVRQQGTPLQGSGLVLWGSQPLLEKGATTAPPAPGLLLPADVTPAEARQVVVVDIQPLEELNYSLLHNQQPLFDRFAIFNRSADRNKIDRLDAIGNVDVSVELSAGTETACYSRLLTLDGTNVDLKKDIHVPLTSALPRSVGEAINSTMTIRVSWGQSLYHESHKVRLLPVDQWRDNDRDGQWLPSFVLPRDPAVERLVEQAQRYVRVLRDDPSAGFEGYQAVEPRAADPTAEVDRQVQAIWSAIVHELDLGYINPPPTYSNALDSQRLRTPTTIERWRSGTCIDLALLLASCLELVDIYPVIFLLNDHAFPGYWRSDAYQEAFIELKDEEPADRATEDSKKTKVPGAQPAPWWFRQTAYDEIVKQVRLGRLVPLESVWLTERSGFADAVEGGKDNLKSRSRFHSMLDIARARDENVTPLPIGGDA